MKTPEQRYRSRMLAAGYKRIQVWVHKSLVKRTKEWVTGEDELRRAVELVRGKK